MIQGCGSRHRKIWDVSFRRNVNRCVLLNDDVDCVDLQTGEGVLGGRRVSDDCGTLKENRARPTLECATGYGEETVLQCDVCVDKNLTRRNGGIRGCE